LLKFAIWFLKFLDYFGLLPRIILELSPFHGSIFFTSMGSLGIPPVFHHLYNFGNLPIFMAFGRKYKVNETQDDGTVVTRKYMDYTFNVDERIVDGFYYATVIKHFHKLLLHPERLDEPEMEINEDIP
ncbi:MAG: 2-oxo acid dehydrogenase subunit E2, partial [Oscillospiraceae bacterium]|nr:2-oxo acid dehydrogenase subunit E2 [Oscillospiraceae bacterium]